MWWRFRHFGSMTDGGQDTEAGRHFVQSITDVVKTGIGAIHAVNAAELAQPMAGLRKRYPHMPGATLLGAALERRHDCEGQEIPGRVVEHLRRQGSRLGRTEGFRFGQIESAGGLNERIEAAA